MKILNRVALLLVLACASAAAQADAYPNRTITLVVGFPPGGGADAVARIVGDKMAKILGQSIVINNKPGAGTTLASEFVAHAPGDGYTLLMGGVGSMYGTDQLLYKSARYDGIKDFTAITRWSSAPLLLAVRKDFPAQDVRALMQEARKAPDKLTYSSSGIGVAPHVAGLEFAQMAGIRMLHVPFKGGAPSIQAVAAGDVDMTFGTPPSVLPMAKTGMLRILAATTARRSPLFPDIPGMQESGVDNYDFTFWFGLWGPAGLPPEVTRRLYEASVEALKDPEVQSNLEKQGNQAAPSASVDEFRAWAVQDGQRYKDLVSRSGAIQQ